MDSGRDLRRLGAVLVFLQLAISVSALDCLLAAGDMTPPFEDNNGSPRLPSGTQAIITSYMFRCCGNITAWQTYVQPGGMNHQKGVYDITFQVWRPSPTLQKSGCYSLVGENRFTNILLGVEGLVNETPEPSNILSVQPGDVVGYYTFSRAQQDNSTNGIQLVASRNLDMVWFHTSSRSEPVIRGALNCPFRLGIDGILTKYIEAAPVLSVRVSPFSCQPIPTISLSTDISQASITSLNNDGSSVVVVAVSVVVVVVVMLLVGALFMLVLVLLLWRRKRPQKNVKLDDVGTDIDLTNPNHYPSSLLAPLKQQSKALSNEKKQNSFTKITSDPPFSQPSGPDTVATTYKSHVTGDPVDNSYSMASHMPHTGSYSNTYMHVPVTPSSTEERRSAEVTISSDKDALYHMVGFNVGQWVTYTSSNGSIPLPPRHPPVPTRTGKWYEKFSHKLEKVLEDPSLQYEDPTLLLSHPQNLFKQKEMFKSMGYYVPTEEQRKIIGRNYEQQYESTSVAYDKLNFFIEDQIYWAPACTTSGLYSQLASKQYREIQRDKIRILEQLGSGQFGEVYKAQWAIDGQKLELAVKTLKPGAPEEDKVKFLQEAAINGQFSHTNVIKMYGIITLGEPVLICLEILANGDLRNYLQGLNLSGSKHRDFMELQVTFLKFSKEIAAGMDYLSQKHFVHRDLAARNILLDKFLTCKVADFGMARDLMDDTYYTSSGGKIPLKWTAPEALLYKKYSADSDVWSYGMVLFEIWSVAKKPFSTLSNNQVLRLIEKGFCQAPPPGCPRAIYELMVECWNPDHRSRPSFSRICSHYLQQSSAKILYWASEDETLSPAVGVCGAPIEESYKLYPDLQDKYNNSSKVF